MKWAEKKTPPQLFAAMVKAMEKAKEKGKVFLQETEKLNVENEALAAQNKELEEEAVKIEEEIKKLETEETELVEKAAKLAEEIKNLETEQKALKDEAAKVGDAEKKRQELIKKRDSEIEAGKAARAVIVEDIDMMLYHTLMQLLPSIKNSNQRADVKSLILVLMKEGTLLEGLEKILSGGIPENFREKTEAAKSWKEGTDYFTPPLPSLPKDASGRKGGNHGGSGRNNGGGGGGNRRRSPPRNPPGKRGRVGSYDRR
eukprot:TRINITY_DN11359_c0_g1_i5.p1 TRINITY_DN11359_c0_g1~~TRINITY_DN11359_c0_g1_i5.p1  ORF type:complete len:258 (+),score=92.17 TRINITY_DN11359_c0_g1_i5:116-889(+)